MLKMTTKEYGMRVDFLKYQVTEADKKLEKARLALRNSFKQKQELVDLLKEAELKLAN